MTCSNVKFLLTAAIIGATVADDKNATGRRRQRPANRPSSFTSTGSVRINTKSSHTLNSPVCTNITIKKRRKIKTKMCVTYQLEVEYSCFILYFLLFFMFTSPCTSFKDQLFLKNSNKHDVFTFHSNDELIKKKNKQGSIMQIQSDQANGKKERKL